MILSSESKRTKAVLKAKAGQGSVGAPSQRVTGEEVPQMSQGCGAGEKSNHCPDGWSVWAIFSPCQRWRGEETLCRWLTSTSLNVAKPKSKQNMAWTQPIINMPTLMRHFNHNAWHNREILKKEVGLIQAEEFFNLNWQQLPQVDLH